MFSSIIQRRLHDRLPEDSGEWTPVTPSFRRLPPPRDAKLKRRVRRLSMGHAFAQGAILGLCTWAAFEFLHERDFPVLMIVATVVGLVTSVAFAAWLRRRYLFDTHETMDVMIRGQLWWMILLLIPCYGWGALIGLGMPCIIGSFFGAWVGSQLRNQEGACT